MTVLELINDLTKMLANYGNLDVTLHVTYPTADDKEEIIRHDTIFVGYDRYKTEKSKIDIRSFHS